MVGNGQLSVDTLFHHEAPCPFNNEEGFLDIQPAGDINQETDWIDILDLRKTPDSEAQYTR